MTAAPLTSSRRARRSFAKSVRRLADKLLAPTPRLPVSAWAAQHFRLSRENSAEPGPFDPTRNPPMNEIMDSMADPDAEIVVVMSCAQIGKTTAILAAMLHAMHQDPGPMLLVMPTLELARAYALERLAPAVRDCRALRGLVYDPASRDSNSTILARRFAGGTLWLTGANSAAALSSRPVRTVIVDETDRAPLALAGEGAPIDLAWKRAAAFHSRKLILTSSPTVEGVSVIADYFTRGDQRRFEVPCLHCGAVAALAWANIRWDKDADGQHRPETASLVCEACGGLHSERDKPRLLARGQWVPSHPGRRIRSYHLNALASPFQRWEEIVRDFLEVKRDRERLRVWINLTLAETVTVQNELPIQDTALAERLERYPAEVPEGVRRLLAGVDTQDNRLVLSVWGFGAREESWLIHHEELFGSPGEDPVWAELDRWLVRPYQKADGTALHVLAAGVDTGGHFTQSVYRFAARRQGRTLGRVVALKGHPQPGAPMLPARPSTANRNGVRLWNYGATAVKDEFFGRLEVATPGPKYVHLPDTVDREYLQQLLAEEPVVELKMGRKRRVYKKRRARSEALDAACYAILALHTFGLRTVQSLDEGMVETPAAAPEAPVPPPQRLNVGMAVALGRIKRGGSTERELQRLHRIFKPVHDRLGY